MTDKINDFISELKSFCDDNKISFSYYYNIESSEYVFRFSKIKSAVRIGFSLIELTRAPKQLLLDRVYKRVEELLDDVNLKKE